ncbi:HNH endonuclease [Streptacidiphilus sp. P02-A3a]|uniref:HNH endonuclease n=1 Tax=Streptacidiphilus sp. P02-A3a TaxID=2704468 RepID=UPI0015FD15B9|nr:HNH endonuclease signature motif containing protein [Streptacidiphilus sp. P02-A3a]QMU69963.1 HNH endonuclease [Streptacidiphilus sp. P02-A3a]
MTLADITQDAVRQAIGEYDTLGGEAFLARYGFGSARQYVLEHGGGRYESKAVVGAAHGYLPGRTALAAAEFSGGLAGAVAVLRRLGFTVVDTGGQDSAPADGWTGESLLQRVGKLRVRRVDGRPALYQPLVLLWSIGRVVRGEDRLLDWASTRTELEQLLARHGSRGERPRPDYPIAALHRADLWDLRDFAGTVPSAHGDSQLRRWFDEQEPVGGLSEAVHQLLRSSGTIRAAVVGRLLVDYFEDLDATGLLAELGLDAAVLVEDLGAAGSAPAPSTEPAAEYRQLYGVGLIGVDDRLGARSARTVLAPLRSKAMRRAVVVRSGGRCENPACTGQPEDVTDDGRPILEVDHVLGLADGGADDARQMIALCPNCHAVKTRGRTREALQQALLTVAQAAHARATGSGDSGTPPR